jgi:hypothetical protein
MATHASSYEGFEAAGGAGATPHHGRKERTDPYRVRALPNEDIYFFRKAIDNTRVVRQAHPGERTRCWRRIALAAGGTVALAAILWPNVHGMLSGYQIEKLKLEQEQLLAERASVVADEARLMGPEKLRELAAVQEFTEPDPSQVVFLPARPDGSLALNTKAR